MLPGPTLFAEAPRTWLLLLAHGLFVPPAALPLPLSLQPCTSRAVVAQILVACARHCQGPIPTHPPAQAPCQQFTPLLSPSLVNP